MTETHGQATRITDEAAAHIVSDEVTFFGRSFSVPGGIYTVVFGALAILTLLEVVVAEVMGAMVRNAAENEIGVWAANEGIQLARIGILVALAFAKAALVIAFYMHLRTDSRIFLVVLLVPFGVTLLSMLFLVGASFTGY
jgi:cytochrome c oxidase subunit IV